MMSGLRRSGRQCLFAGPRTVHLFPFRERVVELHFLQSQVPAHTFQSLLYVHVRAFVRFERYPRHSHLHARTNMSSSVLTSSSTRRAPACRQHANMDCSSHLHVSTNRSSSVLTSSSAHRAPVCRRNSNTGCTPAPEPVRVPRRRSRLSCGNRISISPRRAVARGSSYP